MKRCSEPDLRLPGPQAANSPFAGCASPFGAPVFFKERTASTMEDAKEIARRFKDLGLELPDGTVAAAGFQTAGRGRLQCRIWDSSEGENLLCTVILRARPADALTLRAGLAAAETFDSFLLPAGKGRTQVKWPNDVLYKGKKLSGILCEADGELICIGAGLNINQRGFLPEIAGRASSLALILGHEDTGAISLSAVLELFLIFLRQALSKECPWREKIMQRLFMLGEEVQFAPGGQGGGNPLRGVLRGIAEDGALLLEAEGAIKAFYSGELCLAPPLTN